MSEYFPSSDGLMRSSLRNTIKRIRRIRARAGRKDEVVYEFTGHPVRDLLIAFIHSVTRTKEAIKERNEGMRKHGKDHMCIEQSVFIRKDIRSMETLVEEMKKYADTSEMKFERENSKDKPNKRKLELLKKDRDEQMLQYKECLLTLERVRELDQQRDSINSNETGLFKELKTGRRAQLREELMALQLPRMGEQRHVDPSKCGVGHSENGVDCSLKEHACTAELMGIIAAKNAELDAGLERLHAGVNRLNELALEIGAQLDIQNGLLDKTEQVMTVQVNQMHSINRRIRKFVKKTKPMSTFLNVCCIVLILSLIGFFIFKFTVA